VHTVVDQITIVSPAKKRVKLSLEKHKLAIVDRAGFDQQLRDLAQKAGAEIMEGICREISFSEREVVAEVKCGDEMILVSAEYMIAADGVNSHIRKIMTGSKPNSTLTLYKSLHGVHSEACEFWFGNAVAPQNYAWVFPEKNGIHAGTITFDAKTIRKHFEIFLKAAQLPEDGDYRGYHIPVWKQPLFYRERVFFAGDAAEQVVPFTYEGIYYAMQSAKLLAESITDADPLSYERKWKEKFQKRFVLMQTLQQTFLKNDYLSEKLIYLLEKPAFQKKALAYWSGEKRTDNKALVYFKVLKTLFLR
jgi:geranylgeranyl reductase